MNRGSPLEVLRVFLRLGLTSFGGPIAHLGIFRAELIARRAWMTEAAFAELLGLCQFLPGPTSSQLGFALGISRAGWLGGLAAWTGFTLPSAALMLAFASGASVLGGRSGAGLIHGLKLVAVAIVAQAVWSLGKTLCPDKERATLACVAALLALAGPPSIGQLAAIACGAAAGLLVCRSAETHSSESIHLPISPRAGLVCLSIFLFLLLVPPLLAPRLQLPALTLFNAFYRPGALVFGGGHVVLPLLRDAMVDTGLVSNEACLAGYGAAQMVPGPLFSFAAFLGAVASPMPGVGGGCIALLSIFLPGGLILAGTVPFWNLLRENGRARASVRGANAAVVGLLAAALFDPLWTTTIHGRGDFAAALTLFILLTAWRLPPLAVALLGAAGGLLAPLLGR